jgi:hypothetical protein
MKRFLNQAPFLVVKSEVFFTFTRRRLKESQNVLLDLARYRPSNFGLSTAILMHMIRYVCHTPIAKQGYLRDALRDLRFQEIMHDYGMFFLHDLELENHCILSIPTHDPNECGVAMSLGGKLPKPLAPARLPNSISTGLFPLGDSPAWSDVKAFIGRGAGTFMNQWVWDPMWNEEDDTAARLFVRFTREYFATLKQDALRANSPSPIILEDAMRVWSVAELELTMISCWFVASNHGLDGKFAGTRHIGFREHFQTFFPSTIDHLRGSTWAPFLDYGYIREYHAILTELTDEEGDSLKNNISSIFGRLQCLPVAIAPSRRSKGKIWTVSEQGVNFLTNPIFYKLRRVGSAAKAAAKVASNRLQRVKASNAVINRRFMEMSGNGVGSQADVRRARKLEKQRKSRLSVKTRNKRQPPVKGKKKKVNEMVSEESERLSVKTRPKRQPPAKGRRKNVQEVASEESEVEFEKEDEADDEEEFDDEDEDEVGADEDELVGEDSGDDDMEVDELDSDDDVDMH